MSIDRIGQYGSFYSQYKMPEIPSVSMEEVRKQDQETMMQQAEKSIAAPQIAYTDASQNQAPRMADLENVSLSFNVNETYDYIGRDAGLENLDIMRAISDMQKDKVLEQYQYFVGPKELAGNVVAATPDGMVVQK